ncbi:MAG: energy-coupling factor ABC transporter ATP-binding protein [Desulfarculaceae bacterium]|nr:energy-coupling factor ABC transporter ATP-binding protein [Desulfarculaceae bacterium]
MNPGGPLYQLHNVVHCYNDTRALSIDRMAIPAGSVTGLIGPNGSGKSTLLKLLAFAFNPTEGEIRFRGRMAYPFSREVRSRVTLLTQEPYLLKRNVFDNIAYGLKVRKDTDRLVERVEKALATVGLPYQEFAFRKWHELSGGETQRAAMAARLILEPEVLLLDEPTASVDVESAKLIRDASLAARELFGTTLVISSHDWHWLYEICDNLLHLFKGMIFDSGMENILSGPWEKQGDKLYAKNIGQKEKIFVSAPPEGKSYALIPENSLSIIPMDAETTTSHFDNRLEGIITRMILQKSSMEIIASIMISDLFFTVRLSGETVRSLSLAPGVRVVIRFQKDSVKWL